MAEYFDLELDTTAPVVTWGSPSGVLPGDSFSVSYSLNEPDILSAYIVDSGGTITPLTVGPTALTGTLPAFSNAGTAHVVALVEDEVGNAAERRLAVALQGRSTAIELDTTPPVITWGTPSGNVAGSELVVPYTINEPAIISAQLIPFSGPAVPLTISGTDLRATLPADIIGGTATISATVKDDVWNETQRVLLVHIVGAEAPVEEDLSKGGSRPVGIYGPAFLREEHLFDAVIQPRRTEVFAFEATVSARRSTTQTFPASVSAVRTQTHEFASERAPDLLLAQVRREDDELLLLL